MPEPEARVRQPKPATATGLLATSDVAAALRDALLGDGQFVDTRRILDGLDWRLAGEKPAGAEHSIRRITAHLVFWQDLYLERLAGAERPSPPHDAAGWPGGEAAATSATGSRSPPASSTGWRGRRWRSTAHR